MVLQVLSSLIPTSVGGVVSLLVQVVVIWLAVILADKIIAHQIEAKRSAMLAFLAYFLSPLVLALVAINIPFAGLLLPLVIWVALGEVLLREIGTGARLKVAAVAFVIYLLLNFLGIPGIIAASIRI
jgi:hypothetical protein